MKYSVTRVILRYFKEALREIDEYEAGNVDLSFGGDSGNGNHRVN